MNKAATFLLLDHMSVNLYIGRRTLAEVDEKYHDMKVGEIRQIGTECIPGTDVPRFEIQRES